MSSNIEINQLASLPVSDKVTPYKKTKDPKRVEAAHIKKVKDKLLKIFIL